MSAGVAPLALRRRRSVSSLRAVTQPETRVWQSGGETVDGPAIAVHVVHQDAHRGQTPFNSSLRDRHGAMFPGATVFPEGLTIGSTFDMPLVNRIYAASAEEARAVGIHVLSTLVLELDRDPRMGRNMEAYTEDPYLYAQIAKNIVRGAQGWNIDAPDKVVAPMTDFPTQSVPASGMERGAIEISERSLRENFLPPWISAFNAGALGVMAGYPEIDDIPEHSSEKWNTDILRHELGFKGIVESEGDGFDSIVYENVAPNQQQAGAMALRSGVDMDVTYEPAYMGPLVEAVQNGLIPEALVDRAEAGAGTQISSGALRSSLCGPEPCAAGDA
jgi:beta-glucosidase